MANQVLLPQMGISEESAVIGEFYVKAGDPVKVGTLLFAEETGKSVFEVESEYEGVVLAILCEAGDELPIKAPVMVIGEAGEAFDNPQPQQKAMKTPKADQAPIVEKADVPALAAVEQQSAGKEKLVSPRARGLAAKAGIDPQQATPTGAEGMIIERDVQALLDAGITKAAVAQPNAEPVEKAEAFVPEYKDIPITMMRKTIAKSMFSSLQTTAQLTHTASFDAAELLAYRKKCKTTEATKGITLGDMVLFAVSRTLPVFPAMNAYYMEKTIRQFSGVQLAVAVDIPTGLVVPVIRDADKKSLLEISAETKTLAEACRNNTIAPE
ncbi:MAG TPA: 2-oxo acid dehydrogenase subunit E2, partial [Candidatus Limiplasma sp.]|nr:2-oxo acid dehydrogenase subunit E2 [Candidatus Limiplasma sp.]